ncbi:MAG: hypothetical protein DMG21_05090 [Acidobacteria bacterium]|nr:MAG: hypothetical protein DMG21_05090 [Acidobacteriota bacterium]
MWQELQGNPVCRAKLATPRASGELDSTMTPANIPKASHFAINFPAGSKRLKVRLLIGLLKASSM